MVHMGLMGQQSWSPTADPAGLSAFLQTDRRSGVYRPVRFGGEAGLLSEPKVLGR
jgi:hypothetical protein